MFRSGKGDDTFKEFVVGEVEPFLGDSRVDGSTAIVTAFIPGFVKLGLVNTVLFLNEAVMAGPFFHSLDIVAFEMRGGMRPSIGNITKSKLSDTLRISFSSPRYCFSWAIGSMSSSNSSL